MSQGPGDGNVAPVPVRQLCLPPVAVCNRVDGLLFAPTAYSHMASSAWLASGYVRFAVTRCRINMHHHALFLEILCFIACPLQGQEASGHWRQWLDSFL